MNAQIDIELDNNFYTNPYIEYRRLLEYKSVIWSKKRNAWLVLGLEEIKSGLLLSSLSSQRTASATLNGKGIYSEENLQKLEGFYSNWLMYMDGQNHLTLRRAVVKALNLSVTDDTDDFARSLARDLINRTSFDSPTDLISEVIMPYCGQLMLNVLGIPKLTYAELLELTKNIVGFLGMSSFNQDVADKVLTDILKLEQVIDGAYLNETGFVHLFLQQIASFDLSKQTIVGLLGNLLVDGHEPMAYSLSDAIWGLMFKYGTLSETFSNGVSEATVEYLIHRSPPFQYVSRIITDDISIGDERLKKGDRVLFMLGSGNRDYRVISNEEECPIHKGNQTLSFGYGAHYCPGAKLARNALKIFLEELFSNVPSLSLVPNVDHQWFKSLGYRQIQGLYVQLK